MPSPPHFPSTYIIFGLVKGKHCFCSQKQAKCFSIVSQLLSTIYRNVLGTIENHRKNKWETGEILGKQCFCKNCFNGLSFSKAFSIEAYNASSVEFCFQKFWFKKKIGCLSWFFYWSAWLINIKTFYILL